MTTDQDVVGASLGHPRRDGANTSLRNEFYADFRPAVDLLEVIDELGQILNRIDIMVRWGRNERQSLHRVPYPGNEIGDLMPWQLTTLAGFGALGHLDLQLGGFGQIPRRDAEPAGCDLFDLAVRDIGTWFVVPVGIFPTFAGIAAATDPVHTDRQHPVGLRAQSPQGHRRDDEARRDVVN